MCCPFYLLPSPCEYVSVSVYICYIFVYMWYIYVCKYICIHIYIYIHVKTNANGNETSPKCNQNCGLSSPTHCGNFTGQLDQKESEEAHLSIYVSSNNSLHWEKSLSLSKLFSFHGSIPKVSTNCSPWSNIKYKSILFPNLPFLEASTWSSILTSSNRFKSIVPER